MHASAPPGNFESALFEHGPHSVQPPVTKLGAANRFADRLDAVADLGKRHGNDEQLLKGLTATKARTRALGRNQRNRRATASHSQLDGSHRHGRTAGLKLDLAMW